MKQEKNNFKTNNNPMKLLSTLAAVLILAAIITATVQACKHRCADTTHYTCDGVCSCDGLECK